jgi:RNA polymerase sigma factor (sigma-70 family)
MTPDNDIIRAARQGDERAWAELYVRHKPDVLGQLFSLDICNYADAEELCSDILLQAISTFDPDRAAFPTWRHRITHNKAMDHFRKRASSANYGRSIECCDSHIDASNQQELKLLFWECREHLPPREQILLDYLLQDYTDAEISSKAEWSREQLKCMKVRLFQKLRWLSKRKARK